MGDKQERILFKKKFADMRRFLISNTESKEMKIEQIRTMLQILQRIRFQDSCTSIEKATNLSISSVLQLMLQTDLDRCLLKLLYTNEQELFNVVIQTFTFLINSPVFPQERITQVFKESFRVAFFMINVEEFDQYTYLNFVWTACKVVNKVPTEMKKWILQLIRVLLENSFFEELAISQFLPFLTFCQPDGSSDAADDGYSISNIYDQLLEERRYNVIIKLLKRREAKVQIHLASYLLSNVDFQNTLTLAVSISSANLNNQEQGMTMQLYEILNSLLQILDEYKNAFPDELKMMLKV